MQPTLDPREVEVIGSDAFKEAISEHGASLPPKEETPELPTIQVDGKGNIIGDTSTIDPAMLAQLQSPESQSQIKALWRASRYGSTNTKPPARMITDGDPTIDARGNLAAGQFQRRDLRQHQLVPGRVGRRLARQYKRKLSKLMAKENQHGRKPDQSAAGDSAAGIEHDSGSAAAAC